MNDKYKNIFNTEMQNKEVEPIQRVSNAIKAMSKAMIVDEPIETRLNYITNGMSGIEDKDVDWKAVNELLTTNVSKYDFNIIEDAVSIRGIYDVRANNIAASLGLGAWQKHRCRECGEDFYMSKGEVDFFEKKSFDLPKRCKCCRSGEKKLKATTIYTDETKLKEKSTMQIAMEKAGIIASN